jgi:hypothetical protein
MLRMKIAGVGIGGWAGDGRCKILSDRARAVYEGQARETSPTKNGPKWAYSSEPNTQAECPN